MEVQESEEIGPWLVGVLGFEPTLVLLCVLNPTTREPGKLA